MLEGRLHAFDAFFLISAVAPCCSMATSGLFSSRVVMWSDCKLLSLGKTKKRLNHDTFVNRHELLLSSACISTKHLTVKSETADQQ